MTMTIYRRGGRTVSPEEALDQDGLLKDGYAISVPLMFRDGVATRRVRKEVRDPQGRLLSTSEAIEEELDDDDEAMFADSLLVTDGAGGAAGLHRPGPRLPVMDADMVRRRALVRDAYAAAELADADAWRNPQSRAGAAAVPAKVPEPPTADALQMLDEKERAYYEAELADQNAWRTAR